MTATTSRGDPLKTEHVIAVDRGLPRDHGIALTFDGNAETAEHQGAAVVVGHFQTEGDFDGPPRRQIARFRR
jgi:hypothetical protein